MLRRTTIEVNVELLIQAEAALGTKGLKRTVDAALTEAVRASSRRRLADRIDSGHGVDRSPELLDETRPVR